MKKGIIQIGSMIALAGVMITGFVALSNRFVRIDDKITENLGVQNKTDDSQNQRIVALETKLDTISSDIKDIKNYLMPKKNAK